MTRCTLGWVALCCVAGPAAAGSLRRLDEAVSAPIDPKDPGYYPKKAKVVFSNGVGALSLSQNNWTAPVTIKLDVTDLDPAIFPAPLLIHRLPAVNNCSDTSVDGHFNPMNVSATYRYCHIFKPQNGTAEVCETGDLSSKFGPINETAVNKTIVDPTLTLYGFNSIVGRSVVMHYHNGSAYACGTIKLEDTEFKAVKAVFTGGLEGYVMMVQPASNDLADTTILMSVQLNPSANKTDTGDMAGMGHEHGGSHHHESNVTVAHDGTMDGMPMGSGSRRLQSRSGMQQMDVLPATGDVKYMMHENPTTRAGTCEGVGEHYNPMKMPHCTQNNTSPFIPCELGDLWGRHGAIGLPVTGNQSVLFTDFLPLSGERSVVGKALVFHVGKTMYCANLEYVNTTAPLQ